MTPGGEETMATSNTKSKVAAKSASSSKSQATVQSPKAHKARKATFTVTEVKGEKIFTPVNKRAHTVVRKLGKRTKVTLAELRSTVGKGSYKFYQYNSVGQLKPIR